MPIATGLALGLGLAGAAAGSVASAAIGSNAAQDAASTQAGASNHAADLIANNAQQSLDFQKQQYGQGQQNLAPWLQSGTGALNALDYGMGITPQQPNGGFASNYQGLTPGTSGYNPNGAPTGGQPMPINGSPASKTVNAPATNTASPTQAWQAKNNTGLPQSGMRSQAVQTGVGPIGQQGVNAPPGGTTGTPPGVGFGSLDKPWTQQFQAPTLQQAEQEPGYQFNLQQGQKALENSAAARGGLLTGNTGEALINYGQQAAQNDYSNVYNRALGQYQQNYNIYNNNQANAYNRLASMSGEGQVAANQLNSAGQGAANNVSNTLLTSGQQIGQQYNNAGAATASGYVNSANAINGGISNSTNLLSSLLGSYAGLNNNQGAVGIG